MKRTLVILSLQWLLLNIHAQEFSFQLFFNDAAGNKDTITLGYDSTATNDIDINFGEKNIISEKIDKPFDVRISDEWYYRGWKGIPGSFHTKKQIVKYECGDYFDAIQGVDIFTKHWPVTMSWDTSLFEPYCRKGSLLTCIHPGGWWDVGCPLGFYVQLFENDAISSFGSNNGNGIGYGYVNDDNDTIAYYFFTFGPPGVFHVATKDEFKTAERIKVSPNPVTDKFSLHIPEIFGKLESIQLFSLTGQVLLLENKTEDIDVSHLSTGFYFIKTTFVGGKKAITKFNKR